MRPNQAKQGNDNIEIWLNIESKVTYSRSYPHLKKGSAIRTYIKKTTMSKGYDSRWSPTVYKVIAITDDGKQFMVNNNSRRLYSRHELLRISGVETKDG